MKSVSPPSISEFWQSPPDSLFSRALIAKVLGKSIPWMERQAWAGGGPPFIKLGRHALYRKADVVDFIARNASPRVQSTSALSANCKF